MFCIKFTECQMGWTCEEIWGEVCYMIRYDTIGEFNVDWTTERLIYTTVIARIIECLLVMSCSLRCNRFFFIISFLAIIYWWTKTYDFSANRAAA